VITYSSGNHAQGVAYAAREVGAKAVIVMPSNAPAIKRAATLALGAEIVDVGVASSERLAKAEELVREHGYIVIPPYDDEQIIAGQATCGLEIIEALPDVDLVLSPVSGGGLLSGVAAAVKQLSPRTKVFGVEPELAADTAESFRTGKIVTWAAELTSRTIADGLRTQSVGVRNFAHLQAFVDGIVTVTEAEIRAAMRAIVAATRLVPEPSGAVATAALLFHAHQLPAFQQSRGRGQRRQRGSGDAGRGAHRKPVVASLEYDFACDEAPHLHAFASRPRSPRPRFGLALACAAVRLTPTKSRSSR
jgi:threonine dehydratase